VHGVVGAAFADQVELSGEFRGNDGPGKLEAIVAIEREAILGDPSRGIIVRTTEE
jgi:hypothetical protein